MVRTNEDFYMIWQVDTWLARQPLWRLALAWFAACCPVSIIAFMGTYVWLFPHPHNFVPTSVMLDSVRGAIFWSVGTAVTCTPILKSAARRRASQIPPPVARIQRRQ